MWKKYPKYIGDRFAPTIFFGLYHPRDYRRFLFHRARKTVVWCGSDILRLKNRPIWRRIIKNCVTTHVCENYVEQAELSKYGIYAQVQPLFFGDTRKYESSFVASKTPHVWLCAHPERKQEYGVDTVEVTAGDFPDITFHIYGIKKPFHEVWYDSFFGSPTGEVHNVHYRNRPNIVYHGHVSEEQLDEEVKNYQAGIRINKFDGFSEVTAKALLMGQYTYSVIQYPGVSTGSLSDFLRGLMEKSGPNPISDMWRALLNKPIPV